MSPAEAVLHCVHNEFEDKVLLGPVALHTCDISEGCFKVQREQEMSGPSPEGSLTWSQLCAHTIDSLGGCFLR